MRRSATRALAVLSLLLVLTPSPSLSISSSSQSQSEQQLQSSAHLNAERSAPDSPQMTRNRRAWLALKTIDRPPVSIVDVLRNEQAAGLPKLFDPLVDVALLGNAPENDAIVKEVKKQLSESAKAQTGVKWLDSANEDDRTLLGSIFAYCTTLYAARGVERDCVVQCHPKVDCGAQGARLCQKFRTDDADLWATKNYKMYVTCADRERQFCEKNGAFENEKYPYFRFIGDNEDQKARDIEQYCANIFQMRGMKMPCLLDCTITTWRMRDPDKYQKWKAKSHLREFRGKKDPSEVMFNDPQYMSYYECEKNALKLCRFLRPDYFRECFERVKFKCMFNIDNWNTLLDD